MIFRGLLRFRARAVLYLLVERFSRAGGHVPVLERRKPSVAHSPGDCQARARVLPQALGRTPGPRSCGADCRAPKTNPPAQLPVRISLTRWEPGAAHAGSLQGRREARRARSSEVHLKTFGLRTRPACSARGSTCAPCSTGWGHKSLETTMRYLVPATDVHGKLDQVTMPKPPHKSDTARKSPARETRSSRRGRPEGALTCEAPGQVAHTAI